jgi:hypothetical protein
MTTEQIMQVALDLAGFSRVPEDSAIYVPGGPIRRVLFGLDVGPAELMLARQLGFDLVIAHHPVQATPHQWKLFLRHVEFMVEAGVPEEAALEAIGPRIEVMKLRIQAANYDHVPSVARLLGLPFMNIHGPLDEVGRRRMREAVDNIGGRPDVGGATVGDVAAALAALPEVRQAPTEVTIAVGDPSATAGNVLVAHGALTNGGAAVARTAFQHGVGTVIYIHIDPAELATLRRESQGALVLVGHLAGDALGFTPFLDELRLRGLEVTTFSGVPDLHAASQSADALDGDTLRSVEAGE